MAYLPDINYIRCFAMQMYKELINKQTFVNKKDEFFLDAFNQLSRNKRAAEASNLIWGEACWLQSKN